MDGTQHMDHVHTDATPPDVRRKQQVAARDRIQGWGADLDHANRPAVPMERTPPRLEGVHWERPAEQVNPGITVFHSVERPGLTPVYGTSAPPRGLSGVLRGIAFRYSENDLRHWLILLVADRVDMGEGILEDLARGHVPNLFREMGGPAEWRYNRAGFVKKAIAVGAIVTLAIWLLRRRGDED